MSSLKSTNYNMNKWADDDDVVREEFNQNTDIIDAELKAQKDKNDEQDNRLTSIEEKNTTQDTNINDLNQDVGNLWTDKMSVGAFGLGGPSVDFINGDANTINKTGFYAGYNLTNVPTGFATGYIHHIQYGSWATNYLQQTFYSGTAGFEYVFVRRQINGVWTAWKKVWNEDSIKDLIQCGQARITPVANTPTKGTVTFPKAFSSAPLVTLGLVSSVPGTQVTGIGVLNTTATGCEIYVTRTNNIETWVNWMAMPATS